MPPTLKSVMRCIDAYERSNVKLLLEWLAGTVQKVLILALWCSCIIAYFKGEHLAGWMIAVIALLLEHNVKESK